MTGKERHLAEFFSVRELKLCQFKGRAIKLAELYASNVLLEIFNSVKS